MERTERNLAAVALTCILFIVGCGKSDSPAENLSSGTTGTRADNFSTVKEAGKLPDLAPPSIELSDQSPVVGIRGIAEQAVALRPAFEQLRAALDRTQFDLTQLNAALGFDPDRLAAFVRDEIAYEQYPGVLRGARGTLIARAGNALDQSLLLGHLLGDAGRDWRIVRARLADAQAEALVTRMAAAMPAKPSLGDIDAIRQALRSVLSAQGMNDAEIDSAKAMLNAGHSENTFVDRTDPDTRFILGSLREAGVAFSDDESALLSAEARDYFFVEHRADAYQPWEAVHPAFGAADAPEVERVESFTAADESLHHRVRVSAYVEQKAGDQLIVHKILETPDYTSAELVDRPIRLGFFPNNIDLYQPMQISNVVTEAAVIMPILQNQPVGKAFDLDGRVYDMAVIGMDRFGFTEIVQAGASQVEQAFGGLSDLGGPARGEADRDDFITLTGQWIEYTVIAPGGQETTHRRYLLDRIGPVNREAEVAEIVSPVPLAEAATALVSSSTLMVLTGNDNFPHALDRLAERALGELDLVAAAQRLAKPGTLPTVELERLSPIEDVKLSLAIEGGHLQAPGVVSYRDAPLVAVYQEGFVPGRSDTTAFERVDIVTNSRRVLALEDDRLKSSFADTVRAGVWETHAERAPIRRQHGSEFNTMVSLRAAQAENIPIRVYTAANADTIRASAHDDQTRAELVSAVASGHAVVVPEKPPSGAKSVGWWQIDLATGETLGVATGGYGLTTIEYAGLVLSVGMAGFLTWDCIHKGRDAMCCVVTNGLVALATYYVAAIASIFVIDAGAVGTAAAVAEGATAPFGGAAFSMFSGMLLDLATVSLYTCPASS